MEGPRWEGGRGGLPSVAVRLMSDPRDYKLDLSSLGDDDDAASVGAGGTSRPHLRVLFACCNMYVRVYRSDRTNDYRSACPKCGNPVRFTVAPGGTDARDFVVR